MLSQNANPQTLCSCDGENDKLKCSVQAQLTWITELIVILNFKQTFATTSGGTLIFKLSYLQTYADGLYFQTGTYVIFFYYLIKIIKILNILKVCFVYWIFSSLLNNSEIIYCFLSIRNEIQQFGTKEFRKIYLKILDNLEWGAKMPLYAKRFIREFDPWWTKSSDKSFRMCTYYGVYSPS